MTAPRASCLARVSAPLAATAVLATAALVGALGPAPTLGVRRPRLSPIVFPARAPAIRAAHELEAHARLRCETCHVGASRSARADDRLFPPERACAPCHARDLDRRAPGARCDTCHLDLVPGGRARRVAPPDTRRIRFDHAAHASRGQRCLDCHGGVLEAGASAAERFPTMRACQRCHGALGSTASGACETCHVTAPTGLLVTRFPEGSLNPPRSTGMHHDAEWLTRHRWVGADRGSECASCHAESECADCHDGRVRPPRAHPNDWLTIHPQVARRDSPRCASCHSARTFCAECHGRLGVATIAAPNLRAAGRFHPPADVWVGGPARHGREARRAMYTCAGCHAERDCVGCHGALGIGAGSSPHPPGFAGDCARLLAANARACRQCHGDVAPLRALCR